MNKQAQSEWKKYFPKDIEKKWQDVWREAGLYKFDSNSDKPSTLDSVFASPKRHSSGKKFSLSEQVRRFGEPSPESRKSKGKFYTLVELPYPSGDLHIGHWFTFVAPDVLSRFKRMQGYNVFFPMGYDAFGLPAENAAIKRNIHPQDWTLKNIETMTMQFETMGTMIDWDHVTVTCLPEYYIWNQWIFEKMYEKGIAYRGKTLSNWCPTDQTVLANEHVENGKCWRCGDTVVQKEVEQWFLRITDYAEQLLWNKDGNGVDWPKSVMTAQNDWIGRSEGVQLEFKIQNSKFKIEVFTTALDTIFGVSFVVLAPENPLVDEILKQVKDDTIKKEVQAYVKDASEKTERDRLIETKDKTGVFTGGYVINPFTNEEVPVWVADYVLMNYGTGAVMGVPGHDERDHEFAEKFNLPITFVVKPTEDGAKVEEEGFWSYSEIKTTYKEKSELFNSGEFNALSSKDAKEKMTQQIEQKGIGKRKIQYHLRDWSVSRQRYWGTPVPMIYCDIDGMVPVPLKDLPVNLPYDVDYQPKGKAPLESNSEWLKVACPKCGREAKRDPETLDTFFDSAWYYYRYVDPQYTKGPFDPKEVAKLMPLDIYFGGGEHTLGHTLYARFFTKFFKDLGMVDFDEFALKRVQHGIVLGPDGNKMSKSKGNVINPDDVVKEFGTDAVRVYLSFMMPYQATGPWSTTAMYGMFRFLKRVWDLYPRVVNSSLSERSESKGLVGEGLRQAQAINGMTREDLFQMHTAIKKVGEDIADIKNNTAVAAMMKWLNYLDAKPQIMEEEFKNFLIILSPFAPHITEELWQLNKLTDSEAGDEAFTSIHQEKWPSHDDSLIVSDTVTVAVQINGKLRDTLVIASDAKQSDIEQAAQASGKVKAHLEGKTVRKVIYVPGKIVNFVVF